MVANIGAGLWRLGKWILLSSGGISSSSLHLLCNLPFYFPALRTSPPSPVSLADRRLFLISTGLTKFILHWYVPELH
jgi:hypothetical protein